MKLGLGTGSTVQHLLEALAERLDAGEIADVVGVPTSEATAVEAGRLGIPVTTLVEAGALHLTIDGADEVDPALRLIKGLGGALLREKMVARASDRVVIVADESKEVERLGTRAPLPIEVVPFGHETHLRWLTDLGGTPEVRPGGDGPYLTDNGNHIIDCRFEGGIPNPADLEGRLRSRSGIVESGLFLGIATEAFIGHPEGVRRMTAPPYLVVVNPYLAPLACLAWETGTVEVAP